MLLSPYWARPAQPIKILLTCTVNTVSATLSSSSLRFGGQLELGFRNRFSDPKSQHQHRPVYLELRLIVPGFQVFEQFCKTCSVSASWKIQ